MSAVFSIFALVWRPAAPAWAIALLAVVLAGLAAGAYWRHRPTAHPLLTLALLTFRIAAVALLALILAGPSRETKITIGDAKPRLAVLMDTSGSMMVKDAKGKSRGEAALDAAFRIVDSTEISRSFTTSLDGFDAALEPIDPSRRSTGRSDETHLFGIVREQAEKMSGAPLGSAIVVVSDGRDTTPQRLDTAVAAARDAALHLHTLTLGGTNTTDRVWMDAALDHETVLLNQRADALVRVWSPSPREATLVARFGKEESRTPLHLAASATTPLTIPLHTDTPGEQRVDFFVEGLPTDAAPRGSSLFYEVLPRRIKVLIVTGRPSWETKFLAEALRMDERLEVVGVAALMPGRVETIATRSEITSPPASPQGLAVFDVVIVGADPARALPRSALASMVDYVSAGGKLVLLDSPDFADETLRSEWGELDPVVRGTGIASDFHPRLSPGSPPIFKGIAEDKTTEGLLSRLPALSFEKVAGLKPAARPMLEAVSGEPALVAMDFGRGRVVAVLARDLWRWRLLPPESDDLAGVYDGVWSNVVRWLALGDGFVPGQPVSLELSSRMVRPDEPLTIEVAARWLPAPEFQPRVSVVDEQGRSTAVAMVAAGADRRWSGSFVPKTSGVYKAVLDAPPLMSAPVEKRFQASPDDAERWNTSADPATMRELAEQTGGLVLDPAELDDLPALLAGSRPRALAATRVEPAWDSAWVLALLTGLLGAEWLGRRWIGWA